MKKILLATIVAGTSLALASCNNAGPKGSLKTDIDTLSYEMGMVMSAEEGDFQNMLAQQGSDSAYVDEFLKGFIDGMESADDKKKLAYNAGIQAGMQIKMQLPMIEQQVFQGDSLKKVSVKNFIAGFTALAKGKVMLKEGDSTLTKEEANKRIMDFMFGKQKTASAEFMAKIAKQPGVKPLSQGIYYKEITKGEGAKPAAGSKVKVKYEGKLTNGTVFDTSNGESRELDLAQVIKGWQIAIPQMPAGSTWELYIPYELAYGERGTGPIPPYSALTFTITLEGPAAQK